MYNAIRASKEDTSSPLKRQGSLRKVISKEHKTNLFGRQNEDLNKLYKQVHQEYIILAEYKMLQTENIQGIYVIPSRESPFVWFGVIFVRSGLYEDGIFRFNITLDENFPECDHPTIEFTTEIYHPVVHPTTYQLQLLDAFPVWNKNEQHLWQVLKYVQWIFTNLSASLAHTVHQEAADLYKNDQVAFKNKIRALVKSSQERIFDEPQSEDKHYLSFESYDADVHDRVRNAMVTENEPISNKSGHSWVLPGSFKPLGRSPSPDSESES